MTEKKTNFALRLTIGQLQKVIDDYKSIIEEKDKQIECLQKQISSMQEVAHDYDFVISKQESIIHAYCTLKESDELERKLSQEKQAP
jgi:hypothetical protein